nr:senescence-specific cysteine protease SAG39-like [Ipomoea batatas]
MDNDKEVEKLLWARLRQKRLGKEKMASGMEPDKKLIGAPNPKPSSREESGHPRESRSAKSAEQSEARLLVVVTALLVLGAWASQATARPLEEPSMFERFEEWMLRHARSNNNNNHVNKAKKDNSELKFIKSLISTRLPESNNIEPMPKPARTKVRVFRSIGTVCGRDQKHLNLKVQNATSTTTLLLKLPRSHV